MEYSIPESRAVRTEQAAKALRLIEDALVESVQAAGPLGCPGGPLYAALMSYGCTLETFERFMACSSKSANWKSAVSSTSSKRRNDSHRESQDIHLDRVVDRHCSLRRTGRLA